MIYTPFMYRDHFATNFLNLAHLNKVQVFSYLNMEDIFRWKAVFDAYKASDDLLQLKRENPLGIDPDLMEQLKQRVSQCRVIRTVLNSNAVWDVLAKGIGFEPVRTFTTMREGCFCNDTVNYLLGLIRESNAIRNTPSRQFPGTNFALTECSSFAVRAMKSYTKVFNQQMSRLKVLFEIASTAADGVETYIDFDTFKPDVYSSLDLKDRAEIEGHTRRLRVWIDIHSGLVDDLVELDLAGLDLTYLPDDLAELNLAHLYAYENALTTLPESMTNLTSLNVLDLSCNPFQKIPDAVFSLTQLVSLSMDHCHISEIPSGLSNLQALEQLTLKDNEIAVIPNLDHLTQLTYLSLALNLVDQVPNRFTAATQLRELCLSHNALTALPESFTRLTSLEILDLSVNQIAEFPDFSNLYRLRRLNIRDNPNEGRLEGVNHIPNVVINNDITSSEESDDASLD